MLVNPNEFHRLEGIDIDSSRVFIVVSEGSIDINLNGKRCHIESCSCIDSLDTVTIRIEKCEKMQGHGACWLHTPLHETR